MACTDPHAIEAARLTGHARFLDLCDPEHADYNPGYFPLVRQIATGEPVSAPPVEAPRLITRVVNFAGAVVSHVAAGLPTLGPEAVAARLAVCEAPCPQRLPDGVCAGCGCHLREKARWADMDCPEGLWPRSN